MQSVEGERAKRLMAMGEMAASMAHEIRNPLGSMELFCTLLKKDLISHPQLLSMAEQIHKGIRILDTIISNCLQFARDAVPQKKRITDVQEYLNDLLSSIAPKAAERGVTIAAVVQGKGEIYADRYQLQQAILNLILNAVDAVEERRNEDPCAANGPDILVQADLSDSSSAAISVADSGIGIDSEQEKKIFDPFFTTKQTGTGLGLAIVHSLIRAHGGDISVASEKGVGTTVTITLPAQLQTAEEAADTKFRV